MEKKKEYMPPEAEIEKFSTVCVITTSPTGHGVGDGGDNEF